MTEASSSVRSPRIASSILPGAVAVLYARQGPRRPPLSRSEPPDRRRPLLLSRESGIHHFVWPLLMGVILSHLGRLAHVVQLCGEDHLARANGVQTCAS